MSAKPPIISEYLPTPKMAELIGYSADYLFKNRGILFFEDTHYFIKKFNKKERLDWKVEKMREWVENKDISNKAKNILDMVS